MKSKRYLLFAWPSSRNMGGGWEDYIGDYDTWQQAYKEFIDDFNEGGHECYNIVDITTMKIVQAGTYGMATRMSKIDEQKAGELNKRVSETVREAEQFLKELKQQNNVD